MEVVHSVGFGNAGVSGGVEDGVVGTGVGDHGSGAFEIVHADREYFRVVVADAVVIALQLHELPVANASEVTPVED